MDLENFREKYWKDPVWSKVIASVIFGVGTMILGAVGILVKSLYEKVPFTEVSKKVFDYFRSTTEVNILLLWIASIVLGISIGSYIVSLYKKVKSSQSTIESESENDIEPPRTGMTSTAIFSEKLAGAFPGQRGFEWYESKEAAMRLEKFFEPPLKYTPTAKCATSTPIWWFRAGGSSQISQFKKLSKLKLLIGYREFKIKRIGVFKSHFYHKSFIYVETSGEEQTGVYRLTKDDIKRHIDTFGYSFEEYAIFNKKLKITREEYDDAATVIKGKVVDTFGSELRIRYLSDYNFLIAAYHSPFNSRKFDIESNECMNKILSGELKAETFIDSLKDYEKEAKYY